MLNKLPLFITVSFVLSACTSFGVPVTEFQAKSYDDIESFIYGNFTVGPEAYFVKGTPAEIEQGILWEARFTAMNRSYLEKPAKDLGTYCRAHGGTLKNSPIQDGFSIKRAYMDRIAAFSTLVSENSCIQTTANNKKYDRCAGNSPGASMARAQHNASAQIAVSAAKKLGSEYAWLDTEIKNAERNGTLGVFECSISGRVEWVATAHIENFRTGGGTGNLAITPMAIIRIKGNSAR